MQCPEFPQKVCFPTRDDAREARKNMKARGHKGKLQDYFCEACQTWHLGHKSTKSRAEQRDAHGWQPS